jgi:hypothetical protein
MRRLGLLLLLPLIWLPILGVLIGLGFVLPWWAWPLALVVVWRVRRMTRGASGDVAPSEGGVSWSPTRRSGGLW